MTDGLTLIVAGAVFLAYVAGAFGRSLRFARGGGRGPWKKPTAAVSLVGSRRQAKTMPDGADQLRIVMNAPFEKRKLMSKDEARVFYRAEQAIKALGLNWRVMAQVSLGEVLKSPDPQAYAAINSKRVDVLLIAANGDPIAAVEYQGSGHYLGTAAARDAVKKEALRRAGVRYIEVMASDSADDLEREIRRLANGPQAVAA